MASCAFLYSALRSSSPGMVRLPISSAPLRPLLLPPPLPPLPPPLPPLPPPLPPPLLPPPPPPAAKAAAIGRAIANRPATKPVQSCCRVIVSLLAKGWCTGGTICPRHARRQGPSPKRDRS